MPRLYRSSCAGTTYRPGRCTGRIADRPRAALVHENMAVRAPSAAASGEHQSCDHENGGSVERAMQIELPAIREARERPLRHVLREARWTTTAARGLPRNSSRSIRSCSAMPIGADPGDEDGGSCATTPARHESHVVGQGAPDEFAERSDEELCKTSRAARASRAPSATFGEGGRRCAIPADHPKLVRARSRRQPSLSWTMATTRRTLMPSANAVVLLAVRRSAQVFAFRQNAHTQQSAGSGVGVRPPRRPAP